ncbi:MAG: DUF5666 domain-containing protein [Desulfuromonadales bacterium]|nr:DUF5666 domain-containing protein [Desulfuromonadales bacterium]
MRTLISSNIDRVFTLFMLTLAVIVTLGLTGCGGGGSGSDSTVSPTTGVSAGQITGFGSIIVNGVRFHTGGAELELEDGGTIALTNSNNEDHLSLGMDVKVEGSFDDSGTGSAARISVDSSLEGPVANLAQADGIYTFSVLGQKVVAATGLTVVDDTVLGRSLTNLSDGMVIEVHGQPDGNGHIQASFIEWKAVDAVSVPPGSFELTGHVASLDTDASTFLIGGQLVSYDGVTPEDGILIEGSLVEVKGDLNGATFVATDLEIKNGFGDHHKTEIEGLVTGLDPVAKSFMVRGQLVSYANARFVGGIEEDLINSLKVEVEGSIVNGTLRAVKVKFKDNFRYEGNATQAGNALLIHNPGGPDLNVTIHSVMTLGTASGGQVKVRARQLSGANLLATRVEDGGNEERQVFKAPVVRIAEPLVEILDMGDGSNGVIVVDTSTIHSDDFEIENIITTRADFFAALQVGDIVKARWDNKDNRWDQIEIELED